MCASAEIASSYSHVKCRMREFKSACIQFKVSVMLASIDVCNTGFNLLAQQDMSGLNIALRCRLTLVSDEVNSEGLVASGDVSLMTDICKPAYPASQYLEQSVCMPAQSLALGAGTVRKINGTTTNTSVS